ncbi:hypothetical protein FBQ95_17170 [Chloroflexi bacterium CFX3]|nr:hypothetical protein [Chloroflexi bacterium CFX3]
MPSKAMPPVKRNKVSKPTKQNPRQADKVNASLNLLRSQIKQLQLLVGSQAREIMQLRRENAALRQGYAPATGDELRYQPED